MFGAGVGCIDICGADMALASEVFFGLRGAIAALVLGQHNRGSIGGQFSSAFSQGSVVLTAVGQWQKAAGVCQRIIRSSQLQKLWDSQSMGFLRALEVLSCRG